MSRELVVTQQPANTVVGEPIQPAPRVEIHKDGALDDSIVSGKVNVRLVSGPPGGEIEGLTTVDCRGGVAEFTDIRPTVYHKEIPYILEAECDQESLLLTRPSRWRYYGTFSAKMGAIVDLDVMRDVAGLAHTLARVVDLGEGFVVLSDIAGYAEQQETIGKQEEVLWVRVGGISATRWHAENSAGIDTADAAGAWRAVSGAFPDTTGNLPGLETRFNTVLPFDLRPGPLGPSSAAYAPRERGHYLRSIEAAENGPDLSDGFTFVVLHQFSNEAAAFLFWQLIGAAGQLLALRYNSAMRVVELARRTGYVSIALDRYRGSPNWLLTSASVQSDWALDFYANGSNVLSRARIASYDPPENYTRLLVSCTDYGVAEVALFQGTKNAEWHLEQARRCGVAP